MSLHYRSTTKDNFVQIIKLEKVDVCKFAKDVSSYPLIRHQISNWNNSLKGNIHACPYNGFAVEDISMDRPEAGKKYTTIYPNGHIRANITIMNRNKNLISMQLSIVHNIL